MTPPPKKAKGRSKRPKAVPDGSPMKESDQVDKATVLELPTTEFRAYLKTIPEAEAEELRLTRKRMARLRYRNANLDEERRRQRAWYDETYKRLTGEQREEMRTYWREIKRLERERKRQEAEGG